VDGALVGGASLAADKFARIVEFSPPDAVLSQPRTMMAREVVACKNTLGESPVWSARDQVLYWVSALDQELWVWNTRDAPFKRSFPQVIGCVGLIDDGRLLVAMAEQVVAYDVATGQADAIAPAPEATSTTRPNDGRSDRSGNFVVGMYNAFHKGGGPSSGENNAGLYRIGASPGGGLEEILSYRFRVSNGISFSPDGRTMYFCDTPTRKVFAFSYDPQAQGTNALTNRRLVYSMPSHLPGGPDGAQVDAAGKLWIALSGAGMVVQVDPETSMTDMVVMLPVSSPTSLTFGGPALDTLYITTRGPDGGGLYSVQMPFGVRGVEEREVSSSRLPA